MKYLRGKNAVITGSASGIGRATALEMARQGMNVVFADVNEAGMEEAAAQARDLGVKAAVKKTDVSVKEEVKALVDFAIEEFGGIDTMMNNAGVGVITEMRDLSLEKDWEWIVGINFWGTIYGCHYVLPHMIQRGSGHIINVASAAGIFTVPGGAAYSATKFAVVGMSEVLRSEVAGLGIGVTCVCPALVKTSIADGTRTTGLVEMDLTKIFKYWGQRPEKTAAKILKGVEKNKRLLLPTIDAKMFYYLKRFSPGLSSGISLLAARKFEQFRAISD